MSSDQSLRRHRFQASALKAYIGLIWLFGTAILSEAHAGALQIWPIEVSLDGGAQVVQVNVKNTSGTDTFVQAMVVSWSASEGPGTQKPTEDVMVSPPVFDLPAEGSQTIRLALRRPIEGVHEHAYRLVVTELAKTAGIVPNTLNVAVSMNMPVFVTPPGVAPEPSWSFVNTDFDGPQLVLTNEGSAHVNVKRITLLNADEREPIFRSERGGYVLAGQEKRWPIEMALSKLKGPVSLRAETTSGPIEALIPLSDH